MKGAILLHRLRVNFGGTQNMYLFKPEPGLMRFGIHEQESVTGKEDGTRYQITPMG